MLFHEVLGEFEVDLLESDETGMTGSWVPVQYRDLCADIASNKIPFLVVELFCRSESSLQHACEEKKIAYVGVTEHMDFCAKSTSSSCRKSFQCYRAVCRQRFTATSRRPAPRVARGAIEVGPATTKESGK